MNGDKCEQPCQIVCGSQLFWTFSIFGPRFVQTIMSSRQKSKAKLALFWPIITKCFVSDFFQDGRPENDITYASIRKDKNKGFGFLWEGRKVSTFFLINRFSLHEILIMLDCLTRGWVQREDLHTQASFSSPIISSSKFHLVASVNQRIPLMKVS